MSTFRCTRCEGTGFLNLDQVDEKTVARFEETGDPKMVLDWINDRNRRMEEVGGCSCHICPPCSYCELIHDVSVCDCCGDDEGWYSLPGWHDWNNPDDPKGCR
jgi:RecJ-like exonuclease